MLPKPEKSKKSSAFHQLDLAETVSSEDKIRKKRRFLYIALLITIGLSFLFWSYHSLTIFFKSPRPLLPRLTIPSLKTGSTPSASNLNLIIDGQITGQIGLDPGQWNIYLHLIPDGLNYFNWSRNTVKLSESEINAIIDKLQKSNINQDSQIKSSLPQGLDIKEIVSEDSSHFRIQALVTIPQRQIFFDIEVEGGDLKKSKVLILQLFSSLYWSIVQSLPTIN